MSEFYLDYRVDIAFCIDCTESMDNILNIIKERALSFHKDLLEKMRLKQKAVDSLRVRVVAFRDYAAYAEECRKGHKGNEPMLVTDFFTLPADSEKLRLAVQSLHPVGGGDIQEDGLEALAYAIRSDWNRQQDAKHRHVIVLWTDAVPHEIGYGKASPQYPKGMAGNMRELTRWWGNAFSQGYCDQEAKRLVLFAPNDGEWNFISEQWDQVIHYPSKAGDGLNELDYETILSYICQSI